MNPTTSSFSLDRIRVVLCRTSHPGNIGSAARAMKTMGLTRLYLVSPLCEPNDEAVALASGADDVLAAATRCASLDEALAGTVFTVALSARRRNIGPEPLQARQAALEIAARAGGEGGGEVALVFGNETSGLSNEEAQRCDRLAAIPANPGYSSLNLAAAVQVFAYELRMAAFADAPPEVTLAVPFSSPTATRDEIEGFFSHLERVMVTTGFHDPAQPKRLLPKLRRLFGRTELEKDEVNILRGILSAVEQNLVVK
jgi:tRNA/rRNA methyltransferase